MLTVLIVDDDPHMRNACSRVLSKEGWTVLCAESGDEGWDMIRKGEHKIDAVLLDHLMPGMSGMEVLAQMQSLQIKIPVILITGSLSEQDTAEIVRKGASDCLPKPFTPAQLRSFIKKSGWESVTLVTGTDVQQERNRCWL